jgi:DNA-binding NarL/FixJ family response regulator
MVADPLIKAHTAYAEAGLFSFALKLFRQSLIEVVLEIDLDDKFQMIANIGKTFDAIDLITAEIYYIDGMSQLKNKLYELAKTKSENSANIKVALGALTQTEHMVCELIASGCSTKEIADRMSVVESTVQTHRKNIRRKLSLTEKQNLYSYLKYSEV